MEETVLEQENGTATEEVQETRTFTQEEVNNIVANRLKKESAKYADYEELKGKASKFDEMEEANKTELQKATERAEKLQNELDAITQANELRNLREKVSKDTGVPANLLTGNSEEDCMEQAYNIIAYKNSSAYPQLKDGGEVQNINKKTEADQFAEWFNASLRK